MEISHEVMDDAAVVNHAGEVDMQSSPDVRAVLISLTQGETARIIVNMKDVDYIDSSGLATLVECLQNARKYGGHLRLAGLSPNVRDIFELAKLHKIFDIYEGVQEALSA